MLPRRWPARLARVRPPTLPNQRQLRRHRRHLQPRPTRPHTPFQGGGGQAHAWPPCCSALRGRSRDRTCAGVPSPTTPCSRFKCRGARAWNGWARRGERVCVTTTGTTIPHWNGRSSRDCRLWWDVCRRWWSRRRERAPPPPQRGSACRPAYSCQTESTAGTHISRYESLIRSQDELTRSSFQPPPNKCVSDVPEWAGVTDAPPGRRAGGGGGKKDGLLQKATRWWVRMGARPPPAFLPTSAPPPCVMVPRRAAPSPPPDA
ncbi:uncharacterized protein LOC116772390 isoform X1 [Danaus plexippus]|uniref:uncharacterized protein LOC116772390 isoform X1 n=1 Tax=Danaus plexippus TaxID=13037 RepID=UPI0013C4C4BE|nr:uncharacterized protein LOC116772390 isoform X1 [Danaus plexippus]XP_032520453.1 uncharacterized protein LOC116772390 isoform X1 [Danaus plexippus]